MGIVRFTAAGLLALLLLAPGIMASGFEANGVGVKATAMGGAFRAVADDWTAAYYNPAGYADLLDNQMGANLALFQYRNEITPNYLWGGQYESGIFNGQPGYNFDEILNNPSAGFAVRMPFFGESVFGISAYQPFDYNVMWDLYRPVSTYNDSLTFPKNQFQNNFDVVAFQVTAAREHIADKLSLGVGLQLLRVDLLYTEIIFRNNPYLARDSEWEPAFYPRNKVTQWASNDGSGWGLGFNLGAKLKHGENLTLGASVAVPFTVTAKGESALEFYMPKLNNPVEHQGTVEHLLTAGSKVVDSAHYEAKLKLPPTVGLGMAYQASERLLVSFDAEYTFWSQFDGFNFEYSNHRGLTGAADTATDMREFFTADISNTVDWSNTVELMAGAAFDYSDNFTIMGGFSYDQSPARKEEKFHPLFFDLGTKLTFSTGAQLHLDRWDLGVSTSYTRHPSASVADLEDADGNGHPENFAGDFEGATYQTVFAFNYRF
ncbi:MAG: outer membrane protein transport protein [candidate division Zixibacteria bacterium]|nr:outer membrane protein transport protein [candidate division Zixibacteria bacterium]MDH3938002.1 outer membrane protein transport protein [candidate division Zixibacteria bacterium]